MIMVPSFVTSGAPVFVRRQRTANPQAQCSGASLAGRAIAAANPPTGRLLGGNRTRMASSVSITATDPPVIDTLAGCATRQGYLVYGRQIIRAAAGYGHVGDPVGEVNSA